jgi:hypothetical protein
MTYRYLLAITAALLLIGCDQRFRSRTLVDLPTADSSSANPAGAATLVAVVSQYAKEQGLSCTTQAGTLIHCFKQPMRVWVTPIPSGAEVCYSAMGAPFESSKFATRMARLTSALSRAFGAASVRNSSVEYPACALPGARKSAGLVPNNSFKPNPLPSFKTPSGSSGGSA